MIFQHNVISNQKLNSKFHSIKLKSNSKNFSFKTGQFVLTKVGDNIFRSYSIASEPEQLPYWNMFIDVTPGGPGTTFLKSLKKGQTVETSEPKGQFILSRKMNNYIFGATGCGIAPFIPMISELLKNTDKKVSLVWGLRFNKDIALTKMLTSLSMTYPNFSFEIVLSKPDKNWEGKGGHATFSIVQKAKKFDKETTGIYLSGSRDFVKESTKGLDKEKFPLKKIYFEACY